MRWFAGNVLLLALLASCSSDRQVDDTSWPPPAGTSWGRTATKPADAVKTNAPAASVRYPRVTAVKLVQGRVTLVNTRLRFAVVDFGFNPLPEVGRRLQLSRNGESVGELRVSGPFSGSTAVADITQGDAAAGDDAREFEPKP